MIICAIKLARLVRIWLPLKGTFFFFFWCNGTLTKTLSKNIKKELLCLPMTLVPQLTLLTPTKDLSWNSPPDIRIKWAISLPAVASIFLVTSAVAASLAGGSLTHSLLTITKLSQQFALAVEASIEPLASLQRQWTSLAQVALQNQRALDFLTAEKGGTCLFLQEECCFYVNESGIVETRIQQLHKLKLELQRKQFSVAVDSWWKSSMYTLLMPHLDL